MAGRKSILILGGTGEARALAAVLTAKGHEVTSSLAGRTQAPLLPEGAVRIGGFGGATGLAGYLREGGFSHLIDATHPFAARISANAVEASAATGIPLLRLERLAWIAPEGADWVEADTMEEAASVLPGGASVLLTIGRQEVAAFFRRSDCRFVARVIEAPQGVPPDWLVLSARGPFTLADEKALMEAHGITHLVSKNSGSDQAAAKLDAAAALGVSVVMVRRPVLPEAVTVGSIEEVVTRV
jgi:precorrin-6A/cobalt-precorrin-6A reductase